MAFGSERISRRECRSCVSRSHRLTRTPITMSSFASTSGQVSQAQFHAFTDTWSWADAADTYHQFIDNCSNVAVVELMEALHSFLKHSPMMAYLTMMAPRLVELHRVLKETESLYLHCDPTASHYLKMVLDGVFGQTNFVNEISWKRTTTKGDYKQGAVNWPRVRDLIFYYRKDVKGISARKTGGNTNSARSVHL